MGGAVKQIIDIPHALRVDFMSQMSYFHLAKDSKVSFAFNRIFLIFCWTFFSTLL